MQDDLERKQVQAKFLLESCQIDLALQAFEDLYNSAKAAQRVTSDILDDYAEALMGAGEAEKAKQVYFESLQRFPNENPSKYFSFAQLMTGQDAAQLYLKGIELSQLSDKSAVASAYSALAELYMTDLW
jgi:hypothetical protein